MRSPSPCPHDNTLLDLVEGRLDPVRTRQVTGHLERCLACQDLAGEVAHATVPETGAPPRLLSPGSVVGRHRVIRLVGAGAMGIVYAAHDGLLGRRVALKLVRPDPSRSRARAEVLSALLLREARTLARLSHPHVIAVHDAGTHGGEPFVAMELVEGGTLADVLREPGRAPEEILSLIGKAGEGLAAVHAAGIVHRDFKPENVLVGADGRVKIADFGLAHGIDEPPLAGEGTAAGTPAYMAPEQLSGDPAGPQSDQFAFCATLWRALHGERPRVLGLGTGACVVARAPRGERRVSPWIRRALLRGLAVRPEDRWPGMRALLDALRAPQHGFDGEVLAPTA